MVAARRHAEVERPGCNGGRDFLMSISIIAVWWKLSAKRICVSGRRRNGRSNVTGAA